MAVSPPCPVREWRVKPDVLDETKLTKKPKTLSAYSIALAYFAESCRKLNLEEIDRKDLLKVSAFLRDEKEQAPRSVHHKFENVMTFLKAMEFVVGFAMH